MIQDNRRSFIRKSLFGGVALGGMLGAPIEDAVGAEGVGRFATIPLLGLVGVEGADDFC